MSFYWVSRCQIFGATTLDKTASGTLTFSSTTTLSFAQNIVTFKTIMTQCQINGAITFGKMTFSTVTFSSQDNNIHQKDTKNNETKHDQYAECRWAECRYVYCHGAKSTNWPGWAFTKLLTIVAPYQESDHVIIGPFLKLTNPLKQCRIVGREGWVQLTSTLR